MNYQIVLENIQRELKTYVQDSGLKSLVLGISGGIDSALVAAIARPVCDELGIPLIGRSINITSSNKKEERDRAIAVGKAFCTDFKEVNLTDVFEVFSASIDEQEGEDNKDFDGRCRKGNLKSRMRMCHFYELSHRNKGCVLGTDNRSEGARWGVSFYTLHGDGGIDINPLGGIFKTECYALASYLCCTIDYEQHASVLMSCIKAKPTDGLGVTDEGSDASQLGKGYDEIDPILIKYHALQGKLDDDEQEDLRPKEELELKELEQDVVIKRHLAGKFKAYLPIEFSRRTIFKGAL